MKLRHSLLGILSCLVVSAGVAKAASFPVTLVQTGSVWKYLDDGSDQGTAWRAPGFNDSSWPSGPAQLGYGDGDERTGLRTNRTDGSFIFTFYFRQSFVATNIGQLSALNISLLRDDGAVVYLNGTEVFRSNMPGGLITNGTPAATPVGGTDENTYFTSSVSAGTLVEGANVLAVEVHQINNTSSDVSFDLGFSGTRTQGNAAPSVTITNPANGSTFTAPANITIGASASDADGTVTNVDFYQGTTKLGSDATAPFSFDWNNVTAGSYTLTAVATDNGGLSSTSAVVSVKVNAGAATSVSLIATGSVWKYLDNGSDQGTAWTGISFNDSTWASGPAQLGYGDGDEATVIGYGPDPNNKYITSYFRRTFNVSNPASFQDLIINLLRDDGAVVYINGIEVWRISMPAGAINYLTFATTQAEYNFETNVVPASALVTGANVLAVEVHQGNATSSDVSFDLELIARTAGSVSNAPPTVSISSPTNNATVQPPVTINANANDPDGAVTLVEFFANGGKIGEDNTSPFSLSWNPTGGSYALTAVATDSGNARATSGVVNVTVIGNVAPSVTITNPPSGSTFNAPTNLLVQARASDSDGTVTNVDFFVGSTKIGQDNTSPYSIIWTNSLIGTFTVTAVATDNAGATGVSAPISITFTGAGPTTLIASNSDWKYLDNGTDQGTAWIAPGSPDSTWSHGLAQLGYGDGDERTVIGFGPNPNAKYITYYFRQAFTVSDPSRFSYLTVGLWRDDGAIVYLNGTEIFRSNIGPGPVNYLTLASNATDDQCPPNTAGCNGLFRTTASASLLVAGTNVVAVEVHQSNGTSSDISFDMFLIGETGAINNNPPAVAITSPVDGAVFTDPANININASASDSDGSVTKVEFYQGTTKIGEDTTAPYNLLWSGVPIGSYQLRGVATDNLGGVSTSSVVNVFVVASTKPTISSVSPAAGSTVSNLTQVTVTFSQPVSGVDAADLLVNGVATSSVTGSNAVYTFTFPQPLEGVVAFTWRANHGIANFESPPKSFDELAAGASWQYHLVDNVPPTVVSIKPAAGATVDKLSEIQIKFSEAVGGIQAGDLLINGQPASGMSGSGAGTYHFTFAQPANGPVTVAWTNNHGIHDFAAAQNAFAGGSWSYTLNTNLVESSIVINEIMYHPSSELISEEYIELYNKTNVAINLTGWRFSGGVSFTFPSVSIPGGGYLVVAANTNAFRTKYPSVANVIGNWSGSLANSDEDINLDNANGDRADSVHYADSGDWAVRQQIAFGTFNGWIWSDDTDSGGKSLELINPLMPNDQGQNWSASIPNNGTPGAVNSVRTNNIAPMILEAQHYPPVPTSTNTVIISARLLDEQTTGLSATLFYRDHTTTTPGGFVSATMFDDGAHNDGVAGDSVFAASIAPQPNGTIIEFYIQASDASGNTRTWPAAARLVNQSFAQQANAIYQVDDAPATASMPFYRIVMTATERAELWAINGQNNAEMNATFISTDGTGTKVRYNLGMRHRGAGSRGVQPYNFRLNVPSDRRWNGFQAFDLNAHFPESHVAGNNLARKAGLICEDPYPVQVRINGNNEGGPIGAYVWLEDIGTDWASDHFPDDSGGNAYRCSRPSADLAYLGTNPQSYVNAGYSKQTNVGENDWTDLMDLTSVLNNTPDSDFTRAVRQRLNVEEWVRVIALLSIVGYGETSIISDGQPDDFSLYRGEIDTRFLMINHDHDTDFGRGDSPAPINRSLFAVTANPVMNRFLTWPEFTPLYYGELKRICETVCSPLELAKTMDASLGSWVPGATIEAMRSYGSNRVVFVLSQIQTNFSLTVGLPIVNGYYQSSGASVALTGTANVITTRSVKVNGQFATWSHTAGTWNINAPLQPGINTITVRALDAAGKVLNQTSAEIWYDDGSVVAVSGTLSGSTTWTAAGGPYNVTGNLTVPAGAVLTIQPGTTVYLNSGVGISVANGGQLIASGTDAARIRFTRAPGTAANWGNITINGAVGSPESRISYAHFEFNANNTGTPAIEVNAGTAFLDHLTFGNTAAPYIHVDGASFVIQDCVFPTATAQFELVHGTGGIKSGGRGIFLRNFFGVTIGYNDVVDFTGGNRPGPIVQFIDNVFIGATDDILDLDSTDAWVEHNIFLHCHKNGSPDSSSAISGGADNADTSQITIIGNIIYDADQAANAKQGNFYTLINNTIVHQSHIGGTDTNGAVALLSDIGTAEGAGMYLEGNIIYDAEKLVFGQTAAIVTYTNNIISNLQGPPWSGPGGNNTSADPLFKHLPQLSETSFSSWAQAQVLWDWFSLQSGSPGIGTGPNGRDKGGVIPLGASISGEPVGITSDTSATLRVGVNRTGSGIPSAGFPDGSGYTHYRWRLDGGALSAETPTATPISLTGLANGPHLVQVIGKRDSGYYQDDAEYGSEALVTVSRQWTVNTGINPLRINEVLAANDTAVPVGTHFPDLVELYNPSSTSISLTGMSLTDDKDEPFKFRFPAGATIGAGQYLVLYADNDSTPPGYHLGFSLKQDGDDLYLFTSDGRLVDSVVFGSQLTDMSIGRLADGTWALTTPTFGSANTAARVGDARAVKINEWLADEFTSASEDFIELFNPGPLPVDLGGLFLSDSPFGDPTRDQITRLSFISGGGFLVFKADGDGGAGADHVNFKLSAQQGMIGLSDRDLTLIDCILYGPQYTDVSEGRQPNGSSTIVFFNTPTPGAPNPGIIIPNQTVVINEVLAYNTDINVTNVVNGITIVNTPDFVELYNPSGSTLNLGDMSLTDDPLAPRKYVFTNGTTIGPLGYFVIRCDGDVPPSANNTGFGLNQAGNVTLVLYDKLANGGSELSRIKFGIQAANYSIGRVPNGGSNWVLNLVTLGRANVAATLGNAANLRVNEWMANPASGDDWFEIYNPNSQPVAIGGYYLTDDLVNPTKHLIHELSFIGIEGHGYQEFRADGNTAAGADHVNFSLRAAGEAIGLATPAGAFIDRITFASQLVGVSEGRLPDGTATIIKFPASASPGDANYVPLNNIVINEVLSHTDIGANFEDAIELLNAGPQTNIGGWYLSDSKFRLKKYQIPNGTIIPANGFKVFYEYQFNADPTNNGNAFALNSRGDEVYLAQATNGVLTGYRASVKFSAAENTVSFGRYTNSVGQVDFPPMSRTTFGADSPDSIAEFRTGTGLPNAYPKIGPVVISEIMYHPPDINGTTDDVLDEYVELRNVTLNPVPLYDLAHPSNTWKFRDGISLTFPTNITIAANDTLLVVSFDPVNDTNSLAAFRAKYSIATAVTMVGPYSGKLDNGGEEIGLYKPDPPQPAGDPDAGFVPYILVDRVVYADRPPWDPGADGTGLSLTRVHLDEYANDPANWVAATPTPAPPSSNPDIDGDGMPNTYEQQYGFDPFNPADAAQDADGDGATNLQEYLAGTNPRDGSDYLRLRITGRAPVVLQFNAVANKAYTILYRNNLTSGTWQTLASVPAGAARVVTQTDPSGNQSRFYRLHTP